MKLGIIGSRSLTVENLGKYLPDGVTEIISGGAKGIDTCAQKYAEEHGIKMTVFKPDYRKFGRAAPLYRNADIAAHSDKVIAFWDGDSRGTRSALGICSETGIPFEVYIYLGDCDEFASEQYRRFDTELAEALFFPDKSNFSRVLARSLYDRIMSDD